jgi:hypothetical protein
MKRHDCIGPLTRAGIDYDDALALRRIAMTLQRWHELECGDSNSYGSWAIERDGNGDGPPYMVHHHYRHGAGKDTVSRTKIPDRESGAKRRLAAIMARYPSLGFYIQGDPRGAALYILRPGDVPEGASADSCYSRGVAVYK